MTHNWPNFVTHTRVVDPYPGSMESKGGVPREKWNDERMDEFAQRTEENFREARAEIKHEVQGLRTEMNGRFASLDAKIDRRFNILFGTLATAFVTVVVQHFIG